MGNTDSVLIEEKSNWKKPHELIYNTELRNKQISQLQEFGKDLKICFFTRQLPRVNFQHWYVTDGKWVMEFGHTRLVMETVIGQVTHGGNKFILKYLRIVISEFSLKFFKLLVYAVYPKVRQCLLK